MARRHKAAAPPLILDLLLMTLALIALAGPAWAAADPARACLVASDRAADRHGVPRAVMRALTRTETGRAAKSGLQPWAWTVNMEGAGHWFDTRDEALAYVEGEQARGAKSFDVGCFQVNHRWHGEHFASVASMFDPEVNADYAARFMRSLFDETGAWDKAAGFYHSRTPEFYERYSARFARILARGDGDHAGDIDLAAAPEAREAPSREREPARPRMIRVAEALPQTSGSVRMLFPVGASPLTRATRRLID